MSFSSRFAISFPIGSGGLASESPNRLRGRNVHRIKNAYELRWLCDLAQSTSSYLQGHDALCPEGAKFYVSPGCEASGVHRGSCPSCKGYHIVRPNEAIGIDTQDSSIIRACVSLWRPFSSLLNFPDGFFCPPFCLLQKTEGLCISFGLGYLSKVLNSSRWQTASRLVSHTVNPSQVRFSADEG